MHDIAPYAYSSTGNLIVVGDGPELLVYSGANDQGLWKLMDEDILMGVGVTAEQVLSVDAGGRISAYRTVDGHPLFQVETQTSPITMAVSPDGLCAVLEASGLCLVRPGSEPHRVAFETPRKAAWAADSSQLGIGGADGTFSIVDPQSGGVLAAVALGSPITGVVWRADGTWAVAHGQQVSFVKLTGRVSEEGAETKEAQVVSSLPVGGAAAEVAISQDAAILAVIVDLQRVQLFELHGRALVGEVTFQRDVSHVQFGPKHWLGFGFDEGDANRLDVATGAITRTQTHPGRAQNAWAMNASVNQALVRGGIANVASSGVAIAAVGKVKADKPFRKTTSIKPNRTVLVVVVVVALLFVCCGGGGLLTAIPFLWDYF